jgi:hypothetical protein
MIINNIKICEKDEKSRNDTSKLGFNNETIESPYGTKV